MQNTGGEKSAITAHSIHTGHDFNKTNIILLKQIKTTQYLNARESYLF